MHSGQMYSSGFERISYSDYNQQIADEFEKNDKPFSTFMKSPSPESAHRMMLLCNAAIRTSEILSRKFNLVQCETFEEEENLDNLNGKVQLAVKVFKERKKYVQKIFPTLTYPVFH
jgi:hypothetical protein